MASLHKHSSGRSPFLYCKFRGADGRVVVKSTKQKKWAKAVEVCNKWERTAQQAAQGALSEAQARKVVGEIYEVGTGEPLQFATVDEWMTDWLRGKAATRAPGTYLRYKRTIERFLAFIGRKAKGNLANIRMGEVQAFRDAELEDGVSAASADLVVKTLRIPLNLARRQGLISTNPAEGVELLGEGGETRGHFSLGELKRILAAADGEWAGVIRVGVYTGARLGNCVRLRWSDVDLKRRVITYAQEKRKRGRKVTYVVCPIHTSLAKDLRKRNRGPRGAGEFVFPSLSGLSISGKTGLSSQFGDILRRAEIEVPLGKEKKGRGRQFRHLGFHSLKHSFVSALANKSVSPEIRKQLVGHKSNEVHDIYTHIDLPALVDAVSKLPTI